MTRMLVFLTASALIAAPAQAVGIPVIDPANIAQATKAVAQGAQQLTVLTNQLQEVQKLTTTLGRIGPGMALSMLSDVGLNFTTIRNPLGPLNDVMPRLVDGLALSPAGRAIGISSALAEQAKTSLSAGRQFATAAFYGSDPSMKGRQQRTIIRETALRDAAVSGYALAVTQKNGVADNETVLKGLSTKIGQATDLRADVAANSAVLMAMLKGQAQTNAMLAQLVELEATAAIANDRRN